MLHLTNIANVYRFDKHQKYQNFQVFKLNVNSAAAPLLFLP